MLLTLLSNVLLYYLHNSPSSGISPCVILL